MFDTGDIVQRNLVTHSSKKFKLWLFPFMDELKVINFFNVSFTDVLHAIAVKANPVSAMLKIILKKACN